MSTKDKELSLDSLDEIELGEVEDVQTLDFNEEASLEDEGFELSLDEGEELSLSDDSSFNEESDDYGEISLGEEAEEGLSLSDDLSDDEIPELSLSDSETESSDDSGLSLTEDFPSEEGLDLSENLLSDDILGEESLADFSEDELSDALSLSGEDLTPPSEDDLSDDALKKLQEIDAILVEDASRADLNLSEMLPEELDEPIFSDDLNLESLDLSGPEIAPIEEVEKPKRKKKEQASVVHKDLGKDLQEISGAYSGEMERLQATISNLRSDREELLKKIQQYEEERILYSRQGLSVQAELDEKKIELTIIRKKLNEEIGELKDRLKLQDEKRYLLEEKNKILLQELEKASHKNKLDVKRVQMRERELEQKLELLKADAETQIRNRDLKILELKRKIDAMEFDMESITNQEKRSVESRYELEDKLEKAIKTLRGAISALEEDSDRNNALEVFKKNIDM